MKKRMSAILCTALAAGMALAAGTGMTAFAEEKVLRYAMAGEPETIDPGQNDYLMSSLVLANLYTGLMRVDETGELAPGCAESYDLSEDGLEYTFHLREGLKWSDGSDLTAADFEYAWKRALDPEFASPGSWYLFYVKNGEAYNEGEVTADEVGVEAVDDLTLKVTVENGTLLGLGSANSYVRGNYTADTADTYYGEALAVVRAGRTGEVTVQAADENGSAHAVIPVV